MSGKSHDPPVQKIPLWMRWRKFWGVVAIIVAIVGVSIYNLNASDASLLTHARQSVRYLAKSHAGEITRQIRTSVSSLQALEGFVIVAGPNSSFEEFDVMADILIRTYGGIANLQLTPFGRIERVHPLVDADQDNRAALGHALLLDPARKASALATIKAQRTVVAGPLRLLQGGIGAIARRPIFSSSSPRYLPDDWWERDGVNYTRICSLPELRDENECSFPGPLDHSGLQTYFWGFATMLTRTQDILATTHLSSLETGEDGGVAGVSLFAYELSDPSPHPSLTDVGGVWQSSVRTDSLSDAVQADVFVEEFDLHWILKVAPLEGWPVVSEDFWRQVLLVLPLTAMLGVFLGVNIIFALRRRAMNLSHSWKTMQDFANYLVDQKSEAIRRAVQNLNTFQFPMYLVELKTFFEMGRLICHEAARDAAKLCCFDRPEDVKAMSMLSGVIFISHQWAGFDHPDPRNVQYDAMLVAIRGLQDQGRKCGYIWVDYTSIPQANSFQQQAAINSLSVYASLCSSLVTVAPKCRHVDTGTELDMNSYFSRGWCRLELLSFKTGTCDLGEDMRSVYVCDGHTLTSSSESTDVLSDESVLHVLGGTFTCCSRCHPGNVPCDRQKTKDVLLGIYWRLMAIRRDGNIECAMWADSMLQTVRAETEKYFPSNLTYHTEGGEETQEHFSGYLPILHKMFQKDTQLEHDVRLRVFGQSGKHVLGL